MRNNTEPKSPSDKFEDYLKSIGGLENGFFTDRPPIMSRYFFSIRDGWLDLVRNLIQACIDAGWNKQICQVKEKFGGLRFYTNSASDEVHDLIHKTEQESYTICDNCGQPGKLEKNKHDWYATLCTSCYDNWIKKGHR